MILILATVLAGSALLRAETVKRPKILGVAHIAVAVSDMDKSRVFYRDFLGYQEPYQLKEKDGSLAMTFFKINENQYIELFPGLDPQQDRLRHIAFYTDDVEAMRQYLKSKGYTVPASVPKGRIGNSNFSIKDPEGHTVEFVEYEPDGWTRREKGKHLDDARVSDRLLHVGIIVGGLSNEVKFYKDVLGFEEFWRGARRGGDKLSWVNMRVPDGQDYVEFMLYDEKPAPDQRGSAHHLCLEVASVPDAVRKLEAKPYRGQYDRPLEVREGVNRKRQVNVFDPDGTRTELMEPSTVDGKPAPRSEYPPPHP